MNNDDVDAALQFTKLKPQQCLERSWEVNAMPLGALSKLSWNEPQSVYLQLHPGGLLRVASKSQYLVQGSSSP